MSVNRVPVERAQDARAALVHAGPRVREDRGLERAEDQVILEAFRYPPGEAQPTLAETAAAALTNAGFEIDVAASGTSIGGGTPAHRWLEVTVDGHPAKLKILASTEAEVADQLDKLAAEDLRIPRDVLDVIRPPEWPVTGCSAYRPGAHHDRRLEFTAHRLARRPRLPLVGAGVSPAVRPAPACRRPVKTGPPAPGEEWAA